MAARPDLGVVLVDEVQATGTTISANMVLSGGLIATAVFESSWPLAEGSYYDVETKSRDGDNAFVQVRSLPKGKTVGSTPARWFTDAILSVEGRYGACELELRNGAECAWARRMCLARPPVRPPACPDPTHPADPTTQRRPTDRGPWPVRARRRSHRREGAERQHRRRHAHP